MMCKLKEWMHKGGHYVEIKRWMQKGALLCTNSNRGCKREGNMMWN